MQTVYAYRDNGPMSLLTRWKPRRVFCTNQADHSDEPGVEHVIKFRQGKVGAAALISEVICTQLLAAGGIRVLDGRLVLVSEGFAESYKGIGDVPYAVQPGLHYRTILRHDVVSGPPMRVDDLAEPREVLDLWAFDSWLRNTDRNLEGNTLLVPVSPTQFHLIAADQSDCFGGAGRFADGSWKRVLAEHEAAESVSFLQRVVFDCGGAPALRNAVEKARHAAGRLGDVLAAVPPAWWSEAEVDPQEVQVALEQRLRRLKEILRIQQWEGLSHDIQGGHLF